MAKLLPRQLELTDDQVNEYLVKYLEVGYKHSKLFSIKDGSQIAIYTRIISGHEENSSLSKEQVYPIVFSILESMNKEGAFTLGDATLLHKIMENVNKKLKVPKIREL